MNIEIAPGVHRPPSRLLRTCIKAILSQPNHPKQLPRYLSIACVDSATMSELNAAYRGKNKPTNVIAVVFDDDAYRTGEIYICRDVLLAEARNQNKSYHAHLRHLLIHGLLHSLGYDHLEEDEAEAMEAMEIAVLATLHIANPYELSHVRPPA